MVAVAVAPIRSVPEWPFLGSTTLVLIEWIDSTPCVHPRIGALPTDRWHTHQPIVVPINQYVMQTSFGDLGLPHRPTLCIYSILGDTPGHRWHLGMSIWDYSNRSGRLYPTVSADSPSFTHFSFMGTDGTFNDVHYMS